jgi:hypothetical protein
MSCNCTSISLYSTHYATPQPVSSSPFYGTYTPFSLCHSSILTSPLNPSCTLFLPSGQRTHFGLLSPLTHTISSGTGNSVSIALANGWISSGQWWSHSQSIELQLLQKERWDEHFSARGVPRSLVAVYSLSKLSFWMFLVGVVQGGKESVSKYLIMSFPFLILRLSFMPPRLTLPL